MRSGKLQERSGPRAPYQETQGHGTTQKGNDTSQKTRKKGASDISKKI